MQPRNTTTQKGVLLSKQCDRPLACVSSHELQWVDLCGLYFATGDRRVFDLHCVTVHDCAGGIYLRLWWLPCIGARIVSDTVAVVVLFHKWSRPLVTQPSIRSTCLPFCSPNRNVPVRLHDTHSYCSNANPLSGYDCPVISNTPPHLHWSTIASESIHRGYLILSYYGRQ